MKFLIWLVDAALALMIISIVIRGVFTWVPRYRQRYPEFAGRIDKITEPVLAPIRNVIPPEKTDNIDVSPAIAAVILELVRRLIVELILR